MRKSLVLCLALLAVAAVGGSATAVQPDVAVAYETFAPFAPDGELKIYNAEGRHFAAFDAQGVLVLDGHLHSTTFHEICPNMGPAADGALLHVHVEPDLWFAIGGPDDSEDWHWD